MAARHNYKVASVGADVNDLANACNQIATAGGEVVSIMYVQSREVNGRNAGPGYVVVSKYETR